MTFEILTIIVLVNIGATMELWRLWRRAARRPEKLKKEFLKRIFDTKPITPKHQPPPPLKEGYAAGKKELQFFSDFAEFANVVNWWLGEEYNARPWRLQELPEVDLSLHGDFRYGPRYGRSYAIFHNQERLGTLEISNSSQYSAETPRVITLIQLEFVRVLSFDAIRTFLTDIAHHTCDLYDTKERFQAEQAIDRAMTEVLWRTSQVYWEGRPDFAEDYGEINLRLDGTATWYIGRRDCAAFQELKLQNKQ
jgi:hypothetical protein